MDEPLEKGDSMGDPPSPEVRKSSRMSMVGCAKRLSRASGVQGLPLTDLLATVPTEGEAGIEKRLERVIDLCVSATVRQVIASCEEDEELEETARSVGTVLRQDGLGGEVVSQVASKLGSSKLCSDKMDKVGNERSNLLAYTDSLGKEHGDWKELIKERKSQLRNHDRQARKAASGDLVIGDDQKYNLTANEKASIKKVPNYLEAVNKIIKHRQKQEVQSRALAHKVALIKERLDQEGRSLSSATKELIALADECGGRLN